MHQIQDLCTNVCKYCSSLKLIKLLLRKTHTSTYTDIQNNFVHVSIAVVGLGLLIGEVSRRHSDMPRSVGLLWTSDRPVVEKQHSQQTSMPQAGLNSLSKRAGTAPRLRRRDHRDRRKDNTSLTCVI